MSLSFSSHGLLAIAGFENVVLIYELEKKLIKHKS